MSSYRTQGKDEARSTAVGGSLKELTPRKPKSIIKTDFTFDHYNLENTFANFDTISFGSDVAGKASLVIRFTGDPGNGKKITLTDAAGTAVTFATDTSVTTVDGSLNGDSDVIVGLSGASSTTARAGRFSTAINNSRSTKGHKLSSGTSSASTIIRQLISSPLGNTSVSHNWANISLQNIAGATVTSFTGGESSTQAPFSARFQLVRTPEISGQSMNLNNYKTQG